MFLAEILKISLLVACVACIPAHPPKPRLDGRIVGGIALNITQAPWQVSLQLQGSHFCGGSIIAPTWVITAAHCTSVLGDNPSMGKIRAGSSAHSKDGELYTIKRVVQNKKFDGRTIDYDFSLLELQNPIKYDETKQEIKLHDFDEAFGDNTSCFVTGWGNTQNSSESSNILRGAEVPIVNQKVCINAYSSFGGITPRMICAGLLEQGGKDSCQGDSGGPLSTTSKEDGKPRLVGIVSWGYGCAKPNYPGVYARVLAAREWIRENTGL